MIVGNLGIRKPDLRGILISEAKHESGMPELETTKVVDVTAEEISVTTGLDGYTNVNGLLVKVSMEMEYDTE